MYIVGQVLSPTATQPEQEDPTFAFTRQESQQLDLIGVPIHLEHDDKMKVGKVTQAWTNNDGSKWVSAKIDEPGMLGSFARHALSEDSKGVRYYTGLSLTHTHTQYANGKTSKAPVEISLCVDPRRPDCRIAHVQQQTKIHEYKQLAKIVQMASAETTPIVAEQESKPAEPVEPKVAPAKSAEEEVDRAEMMRVIVTQQEKMDAMAEKAKKYEEMLEKEKLAKQKHLEEQRSKSEAMANALVESWANTLDAADLTDDNRKNIIEMAKKFPLESQDFIRVAHHASKKYHEREEQLKAAVESSRNQQLKDDFRRVMNKTTHVASKKEKPPSPKKTHFMDVVRQYRVSGSGRDLMEQVLEGKKRRRMF